MLSNEDRKTNSFNAGRNGDVLPAHGHFGSFWAGQQDRIHARPAPRWDDHTPSSSAADQAAGAGIGLLILAAWYLALVTALLALLALHLAGSAILAVPRGLLRSLAQLGDVQIGFVRRWADEPHDDIHDGLDRAQKWLDTMSRKAISVLPFDP